MYCNNVNQEQDVIIVQDQAPFLDNPSLNMIPEHIYFYI